MQERHLLLGRPWQYDKNANHAGGKSHYFVHMGGLTHVLTLLLRSETYKD